MKPNDPQVLALIYRIRKAIFLNLDFTDDFREYYTLTGDASHVHILPYVPSPDLSPARALENAKVIIAVGKARGALEGFLAQKPDDKLARVPDWRGRVRGRTMGWIGVDQSDLPSEALTGQYGHSIRQGKYLGSRPQNTVR